MEHKSSPTSRTSLGRRLVLILGISMLAYCSFAAVLDFPHSIISRIVRYREMTSDLQRNQALWNSLNVTHYKITITNQGYTSYWSICNSATLEVENQSVINIEGAGEDAQWCPDVYRALTIESMFNLVRGYIVRNDPVRVNIGAVTYDDDYGFIKHLGIDVTPIFIDPYLYGKDYLVTIKPEHFQIWITDFQPLD